MCFALGFSPSWKVPVRSSGAEPTAHSCGPPHERSQLPGDYRAPGAWGGGRSTRAVALSSLPCLTPPFMSASLAMLSFPPLPLLSLHLASFPCLPPSPSRCTWLCWLPLHHSCRPPQGPCAFIPWPPATCSPLHWRPAPTAALPFHHLPPHLKTSHCHGVKKRSGTKSPSGVLHPCSKSSSLFLPSVLLSPPDCFQSHPPPEMCPALSQPGILLSHPSTPSK